MKKNLAPLVGIAFVVAIISTGIFYGLFVKPMSGIQSPPEQSLILVAARDLPRGATLSSADVKLVGWPSQAPRGSLTKQEQSKGMLLVADIRAGEPVTEARLASPATGAGAGLGIPSGQRAVSVTVPETAGILGMLRPGHRVDVQAVSQRGPDTELRSIVENLQVLHTETQGEGNNRRSVVTLLATPSEADMLAVADSGARIRFALRNPLDEQRTQRSTWDMSRLLRGHSAAPPVTPVVSAAPPAVVTRQGVVLWVRLVAASQAAIKTLGSLESSPTTGNGMRIAALKAGSEESFNLLERNRQIDVLSASELTAAGREPVLMETGSHGDYGFRVRFTSSSRAGGGMRLRVEPEVTQPSNRRRLESELELNSGQSILITGLVDASAAPAWIDRTFPGRNAKAGTDLLVLVTTRSQP